MCLRLFFHDGAEEEVQSRRSARDRLSFLRRLTSMSARNGGIARRRDATGRHAARVERRCEEPPEGGYNQLQNKASQIFDELDSYNDPAKQMEVETKLGD